MDSGIQETAEGQKDMDSGIQEDTAGAAYHRQRHL